MKVVVTNFASAEDAHEMFGFISEIIENAKEGEDNDIGQLEVEIIED